jgi:hypothetical protein
MPKSPAVSAESLRKAEELCAKMLPQIAEAFERHRPDRNDLRFDEIEANSAAVGDALGRMLMAEALRVQQTAEAEEIEAARKQALAKAPPDVASSLSAEDLRMTRMPDKACELNTVRGPVPYTREYLYFPQAQTGIFPPR